MLISPWFVSADVRQDTAYSGASINLALSERGIASLREVGCADVMLSKGLPMYARMIHKLSGAKEWQPYGEPGQHILSIGREDLNKHLLDTAERHPNVHLHFEHKVIDVQCSTTQLRFQRPSGEEEVMTANAIFGNDGAYAHTNTHRHIHKNIGGGGLWR